MCGIAGIVGADRSLVKRMLVRLRHRGPDAAGVLDLPEIGASLGHARLSIIDLDPRSNQPFSSSCGRWTLTFNGEIYNYVELRERLEALGRTFRSRSDTEVLLQWLIEFGEAGLAELDGMFAFCLADRLTRTLLLVRDPIGEKPLYYAPPGRSSGVRFAFASEIKGLLALPGVDTSLDETALADFLRFLYTAPPHTLYAGIRELPPGHLLRVDTDEPRDEALPFYDLESRSAQTFEGSYAQASELFRDAFTKSVALRLRSDVPLGIYLSSGLDSNSILAVAHRLAPDYCFSTFTARYDGTADESALAARAAGVQGASNEQIPFAERDFFQAVERMVALFDQPFGNATAIVADRIAAAASTRCKVCLLGDGGDEIMAGYPRYKALLLHARFQAVPRPFRSILHSCTRMLRETGTTATRTRRVKHFVQDLVLPMAESFIDWSTYVDQEGLARALGRKEPTPFTASLIQTFERNAEDPIRAAALVDFRSFVPFNLMQAADRTSMAHPLELRSPFLSPQVVETALSIPSRYKLALGRSKPLLADALADVLPPFIASQRKRAFNPPMQEWLRAHLDALEDRLTGPRAGIRNLVAPEFVAAEVRAFRRGESDNSTLLWGMATLESWASERNAAP